MDYKAQWQSWATTGGQGYQEMHYKSLLMTHDDKECVQDPHSQAVGVGRNSDMMRFGSDVLMVHLIVNSELGATKKRMSGGQDTSMASHFVLHQTYEHPSMKSLLWGTRIREAEASVGPRFGHWNEARLSGEFRSNKGGTRLRTERAGNTEAELLALCWVVLSDCSREREVLHFYRPTESERSSLTFESSPAGSSRMIV
eukprot:gene12707-15948_t